MRRIIICLVFTILLMSGTAMAYITPPDDYNMRYRYGMYNLSDLTCDNCINSSDVYDIDDIDVEGDINTYVDVPGDDMTGPLYINVSGEGALIIERDSAGEIMSFVREGVERGQIFLNSNDFNFDATTHALVFRIGLGEKMRIHDDGNVNISQNLSVNENVYVGGNCSCEDLTVRSGQSIHLAGATFENMGEYTSVDTNWIVEDDDQPSSFIGVYAFNGSINTNAHMLLDALDSTFEIRKWSDLLSQGPESVMIMNEEGNMGFFIHHDSAYEWLHYCNLTKDEWGNILYFDQGCMEYLMSLNSSGLKLYVGDLDIGAGVLKFTNVLLKDVASGRVAVRDITDTSYYPFEASTIMYHSRIQPAEDATSIQAYDDTDGYTVFKARDTGVGLVEIGRLAGGTEPYFSFGGSQEYKFYNNGTSSGFTEVDITDLDHYTDADISGGESAFSGWDKDVSDDFTWWGADLHGFSAGEIAYGNSLGDGLGSSSAFTYDGSKLYVSSSSGALILDDTDAAGMPYISFKQAGVEKGYIQYSDAGGGTDYLAYQATGHYFVTGNVGIGTATPSQKLEVDGNVYITGELTTDNGIKITGEIETDVDIVVGGVIYGNGSGITNLTESQIDDLVHTTSYWNRSGINVILANTGDEVGIGPITNPLVDLHMRSSQIVIDSPSYPFALSKRNSQGEQFSSNPAARTPAIILNALAQDRPELSYYRGGRTYPEFSIRMHTDNDRGGEIYSGSGSSNPIMTMAFDRGKVGIGVSRPGQTLVVVGTTNITGELWVEENTIVDGNVGIGTSSPDEKLHIYDGNIRIEDSDPTLYFTRSSDNDTFGFKYDESENDFHIVMENDGRDPSHLDDIMTFTPQFRVGIKTSDPRVELDVNGNTILDGYLNVTGNIYGDGSQLILTEPLWLGNYSNIPFINKANIFGAFDQTFDTNTLFIDSADNRVGIGTIDPKEEFHINSTHPTITFEESDAGSNEKVWEFGAAGEEFKFRTANDLHTGTSVVFEVGGRSGTSVGYFEIPNAEIRLGDLSGSYTGGSAHVCVYNNGTLFASESACP